MELQKLYEELKKNNELPDLEELNMEFDLSSLDTISINAIISKILEILEHQKKAIEEIIHPDSASFTSLYELGYIDDKTKKTLWNLFKRLTILIKKAELAILEKKEAEQCIFISKTYKEWLEIKPELIDYIKIAIDIWKKENNIIEKLGYMG